LVETKVLAIDLAATVVFFVLLYNALMHELGVRRMAGVGLFDPFAGSGHAGYMPGE
jgi:hypothetical protein